MALHRSFWAGLLAAGLVGLLAVPARGQSAGDYDGDGNVDGDDFWYWSGCMTGPGGSLPDPNCAAFDFDFSLSDGKVDLADLAAFGRAFTGKTCTPGYWYSRVRKAGNATGCSASIRTRTTTLCGKASATSAAGSLAWAGVTKLQDGEPVKYAQTGYFRYRIEGSSTVYLTKYAETKAGPDPVLDYDMKLPGEAPSDGTHVYRCWLPISAFGSWLYYYDGSQWYSYAHDGWRNVTGTVYEWNGEIQDRQDQMVGTVSAKCDFTQCSYNIDWASWFDDAEIMSADLYSSDLRQWGIERINATGFRVWDKKP